MKTVIFRPLRLVKKTGKITVASYQQWRKVRAADYSKFNLVVINDYKDMNDSDPVFDHKGEQLFFWDYNPADIPVIQAHDVADFCKARSENNDYGIVWQYGDWFIHHTRGVDCEGVPTFNHYTADYIGTHYKDMNQFAPLTVGMVKMWIGWFLYQLKNSYLTIGG